MINANKVLQDQLAHITTHARQLIMGLGRSNTWRHTFADICQKYAVATI